MRLIDADKVLEFMNNKLEMQELYLPIHLKELVTDEMPTAFDKDKVIEQLQRQVDQYHRRAKEAGLAGCAYESCHNYSKACSYECAIEIVRGEQE